MKRKILTAVCSILLFMIPFAGCSEKSSGNMQTLLDAQIGCVVVASSGFSSVIYPYDDQEKIGEFVAVLNKGGEYTSTEETKGAWDFLVVVSFSQKEEIIFYLNEDGYIHFAMEEKNYKTLSPVADLQEQIKGVVGDEWTH